MKIRLALSAALLIAAPVFAQSGFETVGVSYFPQQRQGADARGEALGLAVTAAPEGPAAASWNPAAPIEGYEAAVGWHTADQLVDGLGLTALSASAEVGVLRLGAYEIAYGLDGAPAGTAFGPATAGDLRSRLRAGGLSLDAGRLLFGDDTPLFASAGVVFKSFRHTWDGETLAEATDTDAGVILGGRGFLGDSDDVHRGWIGLKFAGVLINTGRSGIDLPGNDGAADARLEQRGRLGLALEGHHGWHYRLGHVLSWLVTADLEKSRPGEDWSDETLLRAGAELTLYGLVSGRVGRIDRGDDNPYTGLTYGVGLRIAPLGRPIGVRGDWASVPYDPGGAGVSLPYAKQRLDRFSVAVWLDL